MNLSSLGFRHLAFNQGERFSVVVDSTEEIVSTHTTMKKAFDAAREHPQHAHVVELSRTNGLVSVSIAYSSVYVAETFPTE
ncbi:hypothetical protein [Caballeronia sp. ATUFL_M1_KS5A]|uniref:hypothetical protein n=1 Tax=Caballeronia sp. ATUFL_M1_KS5A TaxID=2921778 RepID=UPI0020279E83|nr:hypothetical protein [Caballeronia sp. ATUFL_M1_KS5A]